MRTVAEHFERTLGADAVRTDGAVWRFACAGVVPSCVVQPRSVDEVSAAVRVARDGGYALVPSGNGTDLHIGLPPRRYDAAVSTRALNHVLAHEAGDMTVTVEAGVTVPALNEVLGSAGQWLPVDPPRAEQLTVGGLIAADRNGPYRFAYGKVRDYLIGLKVVTADGEVVRGGGRVVKNVAGYDLPKLFVGSFGTLGAIVEATFKVRPRPEQERVWVWRAASIDAAIGRALEVMDSSTTPVLLEAINGAAAEAIGVGSESALIVGCAGNGSEVEAATARLRDMARDGLVVCDTARAGALLKAVRDFPQAATEDALVARVSVLPAALPALLGRFEAEAAARGLQLELAAHAGNGVAWCQMTGAVDATAVELFAEWMRVFTRQSGGWAIFEYLPPFLRGRIDPWGFNERAVSLMARIKQALDPGGVFSPGRFVEGI